MTTNYNAGRAIEYKVIEVLKENGISATRTAGSHGEYDVVGVAPNRIHLVQVKKFKKRGNKYASDVNKLLALPSPDCVVKSIAIWQEGVGWYLWADLKTGKPMFQIPSPS